MAFVLTGALNFKDGETLGAGHVSKQDGFAFIEIPRSGGDALKAQAPVITMTDQVLAVLEKLAVKRNAKRATDPGNTYGPTYTVGSPQDIFTTFASWMFATYNHGGALNDESVKDMASWIAPPTDSNGRPQDPAGFPNGPTRLYWDAWNFGFTAIGSPSLIGYYIDDVQDQEMDFASQSQDVTSILHFNSGLGWRTRGLETMVEQVRQILTDATTTEEEKKKKYVEWLISNNLPRAGELDLVKKGVSWIGAASTHDRAMNENANYKRKYMEFVDMALLLQSWGGQKPSTLDVFIAYDLASFEAFHLFGIDSLNDIVATAAGAVFGEMAGLSPYPPILSTAQTKAALNSSIETARTRFRAHRILNPKEQTRRSLYALLTSTDDQGQFLNSIVEPHWAQDPRIGVQGATIWRLTIGAFCKKNETLFDTEEHRKEFINNLESHLTTTEGSNWRAPFTSSMGIVSTDRDVEMLHQAIEFLVLLHSEAT